MASKISSRVSSIASMATSASNAIRQKMAPKDDIPFLERQIISCPSWATVKKKVRSYSKKWFTHVGLVSVLLGYLVLGGYIFMTLEGEHERQVKREIETVRNQTISNLWKMKDTILIRSTWNAKMDEVLSQYEDTLKQAVIQGIKSNSKTHQWTLMGSMFFASTVITTIGK